MKNNETLLKLKNPSQGSRQESILSDEMLAVFCQSQIDWFKEDTKELYGEMAACREPHNDAWNEYVRSHRELDDFCLQFSHVYGGYSFDYHVFKGEVNYQNDSLNVLFYHEGQRPEKYCSRYRLTIPFGARDWYEMDHTLRYEDMVIETKNTLTLREIEILNECRDWVYMNQGFFESIVEWKELQFESFDRLYQKSKKRLAHNQAQIALLEHRLDLALKRGTQSLALQIIQDGYKGEEVQLFRKRDVPMMVEELEVLRITPSHKSVDIRIVGRDFKNYEYGHYGIWRTGTAYHEKKEWIQKGVRVETLLGIDITGDYSEEANPFSDN